MSSSKFVVKYLEDLKIINNKIDSGSIEGVGSATDLFQTYVDDIIKLGRFTPQNWNHSWRKEVYQFGEKLKELDSVEFLKILDKDLSNKDEQEILDFFKSEIEINSQPFDYGVKKLKRYISKYPNNPEFRHSLATIYFNKNKIKKAINHYEFAFNKENTYREYLLGLFNAEHLYIEKLIEEDKQDKALEYCEELQTKERYDETHELNNLLYGLKQRVKDSIIIKSKLKDAEEQFKLTVRAESEKERKRLIEILSFFSAIIAFIFSTVSIGANYPFEESLIFLVVLAIVLILFLFIANVLFGSESFNLKNSKTLIIIILIISLLFIMTDYTTMFWT